ncbi:MAG TPA: tetratricopeptide repeat protein [Verrucomicrobiae bacterium]|nr:tetratricopeptide repeat protein [Verrucomicrobiae bacterium]
MKNASKSLGGSAALIVLLTVVAYVPVLHGGFVFDDHELITGNRMVKASDGLYRFWFTSESPDYRPLTWSLWWSEWRLWDGRATGYHVVNVLLLAVNAVLVWLILRRLKVSGAWLAAVVFAIHPVNVATGAWISEQKNTLSMLFYALAILLYLKFDEEGRRGWYGLSVGAFFLALLSKTAVVMLPVVLLGCGWWRHGRVRARDWLYSLPYFVGSLALALVTILQHQRALPVAFVRPGSFGARLAMAGQVPWFYLSKALLPVDLMLIYPKWEIDPSRWVSYVPGIILIGGLIVFWWKRNTWGRTALFGLGYFVVMLFPVLGFFDQGFYLHTLVADHWQYHSIIGVIALTVAAGREAVRRMSEWGRSARVLAPLGAGLVSAVLVVVLGTATWRRSRIYADAESLWQDNVAKNPGAWVAQNNLGIALQGSGEAAKAKEHYEQALRLNPDSFEVHNNLGSSLLDLGRVPEAMGQFEQALRLRPDYAEAHNNLGNALLESGKVPEAVEQFEQVIQLKPDYAGAHYNLGVALVRLGKMREAIEQWERALSLKPDDAEVHNSLGIALYRSDDVAGAIGHYEQALRLRPDYVDAHQNLGIALTQAGRLQEAVEQFEQALRLKPNYAEAHYCLGDVLFRLDRVQEAVGHYEQALRLKPDYVDARNNLGAALLRLGKAQEAINQFEEVLRLKPDLAATHYNLAVALEQAGRIPEAIEQYEQVLRLKPGYAAAQDGLARLRAVGK